MLIDWFTVGAQVLNFLILAWLLKRFLYRPILDAIDARERRIASELADANTRKAEAGEERAIFEQKNASFDKERANLLRQATQAANNERERLLDAARQEAAALSLRRQEALQAEMLELHEEISRRAQREVFAIARKALGDLAGVTLEERMVTAFVDRLQALGEGQRKALADTLKHAFVPVIVRSTFALSPALQGKIRESVRDVLGAEVEPAFEVTPELVSGLELCTDGQTLAWSIDAYLTDLERSVAQPLRAREATPQTPGQGTGDVH